MVEERRPYPPLNKTLYAIVKFIFLWLFRLLSRMHVTGSDNIPKEGGFIMLSNHLSVVDSPLMFVVNPRHIYVLAADKYERHPLFGPLLRVAGGIFINRANPGKESIRQVLAVLQDGYCLGMAVEGTRSKTGGLQPGKTGAAFFATRAGVPVIPTAIWGTDTVPTDLKRLRRPHLFIHFAEPIYLPQGRARSEQLEAYTEDFMVRLARLLPEQYRGVYRDHPLVSSEAAPGRGAPLAGQTAAPEG
jgi:1-acyl-sn-glycerol-3-phosphate acyltransferase